jgi:hypothetical protein
MQPDDAWDADASGTALLRGFTTTDLAEGVSIETDALFCGVLRTIAGYGHQLTRWRQVYGVPCATADTDFPFLWRAIHPQGINGRPCYNPAGKNHEAGVASQTHVQACTM